MNYEQLAEDILDAAGGPSNIASFTNCMTRLRLDAVDSSIIDVPRIKSLSGVLGVIEGDQTQVVVGPGHSQRLRDAFAKTMDAAGAGAGAAAGAGSGAAGAGEGADTAEAARASEPDAMATLLGARSEPDLDTLAARTQEKIKARQTSRIQRAFRHVGNIFIPIIPGFIACGIVASIANIWKMVDPSVLTNPWFLAFAAVGSVLITGLHFVVGHNTAKEFGGTPILGVIAGGIPYMTALAGIPANEETGAAAVPLVVPLFGQLAPALGGVLGVMATAWLFTVIEKYLRRIVPVSLDLFIIPAVTVIIGGAVSVLVLMPISALLMSGLTWLFVDFGLEQGGVIGGFLMAALFLPMVMLGIHQGLTPLHAELISTQGFTALLPILAMAGAGQDGMAVAVWMKTKNEKLKKIIKGALPLGLLGIGEPLIYGVSLPLFYPFITACLGAGFGGAFVAWGMSTVDGGFGSGALGLSGVLMTAVISPGGWLWYLGGIAIGAFSGFLLTYFFGFKESMEARLD